MARPILGQRTPPYWDKGHAHTGTKDTPILGQRTRQYWDICLGPPAEHVSLVAEWDTYIPPVGAVVPSLCAVAHR